MSYRAKAKTIAQAVVREITSATSEVARHPFYSFRANWGTKVQKRLAYVEDCERTFDFGEFCRATRAIKTRGSIRAAVLAGDYDR